jgi:uncharacterized SAM-dependent methyltransferase
MSPSKTEDDRRPRIFDIRQDRDCLDLRKEIVASISTHPPALPPVLLWDDRGQELFDQFSQTTSYYSFHSEMEILDKWSSEIAHSVPAEGALVELGCG